MGHSTQADRIITLTLTGADADITLTGADRPPDHMTQADRIWWIMISLRLT